MKIKNYMISNLSKQDFIDFAISQHCLKYSNGIKDATRELDFLNELSKEDIVKFIEENY